MQEPINANTKSKKVQKVRKDKSKKCVAVSLCHSEVTSIHQINYAAGTFGCTVKVMTTAMHPCVTAALQYGTVDTSSYFTGIWMGTVET